MPIQEVVKRHPLTSTKAHHIAKNKQFSTLRCTKTGGTQPKLSAACFVVQSCLADADFVVFSNYCLIGTRLRVALSCFWCGRQDSMADLPWGQIVSLPPVFELVAAKCHWHLAFKWVRVLTRTKKTERTSALLFLVRATGLEPARFRRGT